MKILSVRKAYGREVEAACIMITEDCSDTPEMTAAARKNQWNQFHEDAQRIFDILCHSLPGMTFDRLYQLMREEKNL